jgi:hypothetical protein
MKQKIYEIPIWDAYKLENCECPICELEKNCDNNFIDALFTEMVMDVRLNPHLVEDYDFCHGHFEKLYKYPDKCGLAVLTNRILYSKRKNLKVSGQPIKRSSLKSIFSKSKAADNSQKTCLLCKRLQSDMENYMGTLITLWLKDESFKSLYKNSRGLCANHFIEILGSSAEKIKNSEDYENFKDTTIKLQENNLERLQNELEWFISKFDYRFTNEPWKTSKDALKRTVQKLIGNYDDKI